MESQLYQKERKVASLSMPLSSPPKSLAPGIQEQSKGRRENEHYGLNVCITPKFISWNPNFQDEVLAAFKDDTGTLKKWVGHEGRASWMGSLPL